MEDAFYIWLNVQALRVDFSLIFDFHPPFYVSCALVIFLSFFVQAIPPVRSTPSPSHHGSAVPNPTLFVENLPEDCDQALLQSIFRHYPGCKDIRHIAVKRVAFIDFENIPQAGLALQNVQNYTFRDGQQIRVSYAK